MGCRFRSQLFLKGSSMVPTPRPLSTRLKHLGFTQGSQMKLYGEKFEVAGEPIVVTAELVLVDAVETKSGQLKRIRIPLPILKMAHDSAP